MNVRRAVLLSVLAGALLALLAPGALAEQPCVPLSGSLSASFDFGQGGWVGTAFMTFGDGPLKVAALVDMNNGYKPQPAKGLSGWEILTFTFGTEGAFQMKGRFVAMPGTSPGWINFSETGRIDPESGTGAYAGVTGNMSIHGPVVANFEVPEIPWVWVSQISGSICGAP